MRQLVTPLLLVLTATLCAFACRTPADDADAGGAGSGGRGSPGGSGGGSAGAGPDELGVRCEFLAWPSPDATPLFSACETTAAPWDTFLCSCADGSTLSVPNDRPCDAILAQACGVDPTQPDHCSMNDGVCWPDGDGWQCKCERPESPLQSIARERCEVAAQAACHAPESCSSGNGSCVTSIRALFAYDCVCALYGEPPLMLRNSTCENALLGCHPTAPCNSWRGTCEDLGGETIRCRCLDGTVEELTYEQLGGESDCNRAMEAACLGVELPADVHCEARSGEFSGSCDRAEVHVATTFSCECSPVPGGQGGAGGGGGSNGTSGAIVVADSCAAALGQFCPDAVP